MNVDLGLAKTLNMPWSEKHQLQLRWDVFNVANQQSFGLIDLSRTGIGVARDPALRGLNRSGQLVELYADPGSAASDAGRCAVLVLVCPQHFNLPPGNESSPAAFAFLRRDGADDLKAAVWFLVTGSWSRVSWPQPIEAKQGKFQPRSLSLLMAGSLASIKIIDKVELINN